MVPFTRFFATRLRRLAWRPARATDARSAHSLGVRSASAEAWARLERALLAPSGPAAETRARELAQENVRLALTLIGQQGRGAVARILAACDGEPAEASEAIRVALAVAGALGHSA
jgi:hypothetical protein